METIKAGGFVPFRAIHVGEHINDEMRARGLKQKELASMMGIQASVLCDIINGKRVLSSTHALKLEQLWGTPAAMWLNLQSQYEIDSNRHAKIDK